MQEGRKEDTLKGKKVAVSGSGNVAQFAVEKLLEIGSIPVTMSDSKGTIYEPEGFTVEGLHQVMKIKAKRGCLTEYKPSEKGASLILLLALRVLRCYCVDAARVVF